MMRRILVVIAFLILVVPIVYAQVQVPNIIPKTPSRKFHFVRQPDTTCACLSDTTMGPSVFCFGAKQVIWRLQANSGTCSTLTVQVSNNDTNYINAPTRFVNVISPFAVGDSLNQGGAIVVLGAVDSLRGGFEVIPWRFTRMFVRQRAGVTSNNDCTILCRAKVDSLRFLINTVLTAP